MDYYYKTSDSHFLYLVEIKTDRGEQGFWCDRVQMIPAMHISIPNELFEI